MHLQDVRDSKKFSTDQGQFKLGICFPRSVFFQPSELWLIVWVIDIDSMTRPRIWKEPVVGNLNSHSSRATGGCCSVLRGADCLADTRQVEQCWKWQKMAKTGHGHPSGFYVSDTWHKKRYPDITTYISNGPYFYNSPVGQQAFPHLQYSKKQCTFCGGFAKYRHFINEDIPYVAFNLVIKISSKRLHFC